MAKRAAVILGYYGGDNRGQARLAWVSALDRANVMLALEALTKLDYRPRAPVPIDDFADAAVRESWIQDKGLTVFSLWSPRFAATSVDLFVRVRGSCRACSRERRAQHSEPPTPSLGASRHHTRQLTRPPSTLA